jgi:hypothetical protein
MSVILNSTGITYSDGTSESTRSIPSGANTIFFMASAPTNWTQITTHNDKALRVVSGAGAGTGGSVGFSTAFASQAVGGTIGSYTLTTSDIPAHNHSVSISDPGHNHGVNDPSHSHGLNGGYINTDAGGAGDAYGTSHNQSGGIQAALTGIYLSAASTGITASSGNVGGGGGHTHGFTGTAINMAVNYIDFILCTKN